MNFILVSETL